MVCPRLPSTTQRVTTNSSKIYTLIVHYTYDNPMSTSVELRKLDHDPNQMYTAIGVNKLNPAPIPKPMFTSSTTVRSSTLTQNPTQTLIQP